MRVDLTSLAGKSSGSVPFSLEAPAGEWIDPVDPFTFTEPVRVEGVVEKDADGWELKAQMQTAATAPCDRCLSPVTLPIACSIRERVSPESVVGNCLELTEPVAAALLESLPMKVVCREDCLGLCPTCGKDLNTGPCDCRESQTDPRFDGLRALFKLDEEV